MAFKPLGGLLPQQLRRAGVERGVMVAQILVVANLYLDEKWGEGTTDSSARAIAFKYGKLQIASIHAPFRQEIQLNAVDICNHVNTKLGRDMVKTVQAIF
jgi:hypothetical protein